MKCVVEVGGLHVYEILGEDGEAFMRCVVEMGGLYKVRGGDKRPA